MLLSDLSSLRLIARPAISDYLSAATTVSKAVETGDPELDRMYNQSPVITEFAATYQPDVYKTEDKEGQGKNEEGGQASKAPLFAKKFFKGKPNDWKSENYFAPKPVTLSEINKSGLSMVFEEVQSQEKENKGRAGKLALTIFLPNTDSMKVYAAKSATFGQLIELILKEHQREELRPQLSYDQPGLYELRIHEGDGEPDRDFAALENENLLKDYDLEEYCLCEVEREDSDFGSPMPSKNVRNMSINDSLFSPSQFGTMGGSRNVSSKNSNGNLVGLGGNGGDSNGNSSRYNRNYDDDDDFDYNPNKFPDEDDFFDGSTKEDAVTIRLPKGHEMSIPISPSTTFHDLLPIIAKSHKLRIYTDEYSFVMTPADMKRCKFMVAVMDSNMQISSTACRIFEIQKKAYSDSSRLVPKPPPPAMQTSNANNGNQFQGGIGNNSSNPLTAMVTAFTETAANAYQEWNVVKKNKFGMKQERVFGVDGKKVYNSRRGQLKGGAQPGVHRAERDISTIVKIEIIPDEQCPPQTGGTNNANSIIGKSKTLRITWADHNDVYNIEYSCDTSRECIEVVAKIKYLLAKKKAGK